MRRSTLALAAGALALTTSALAACSGTAADDAWVAASEQGLASNVHVLTSRNDAARTGANLAEKVLTTSNVGGTTFGKLFTRNLDGQVYAQPLYVGGVNGKNLVYVATEHNTVYAFDADDLRVTAPPVWQKNFGPSVPAADTGCVLLTPEIGITSTPVIDVVAKTIWFTAKTKENGAYVHRLHALDIANGLERANSPVAITASAPGTGAGSVGGIVTMNPLRHMNRPGLLKAGNSIYLGFASNCDIGPYHGWVLGYDATTLAQTAVHVDTPDGSEGGIWHGGVGLNADENGDVFYVSGNGTFDGVSNFGNSVVRLHPDGAAGPANGLTVASFFTPFDSSDANDGDFDLGSTGGMLIPGTQLLVTGDKRGFGFLVNKNQLGGMVDQDSQIVQRFQGSTRGMFGGAAFYKKGAGGSYYLWVHGRSTEVVRVRRDAIRPASSGEHQHAHRLSRRTARGLRRRRAGGHGGPLDGAFEAHERRPCAERGRRRAPGVRRARRHPRALVERREGERHARLDSQVRAAHRRERSRVRGHGLEPARRVRALRGESSAGHGRARRGQ